MVRFMDRGSRRAVRFFSLRFLVKFTGDVLAMGRRARSAHHILAMQHGNVATIEFKNDDDGACYREHVGGLSEALGRTINYLCSFDFVSPIAIVRLSRRNDEPRTTLPSVS